MCGIYQTVVLSGLVLAGSTPRTVAGRGIGTFIVYTIPINRASLYYCYQPKYIPTGHQGVCIYQVFTAENKPALVSK